MAKINLLIIGAQKAATTFVQRSLAQHPEIAMRPGEWRELEDPDFRDIASVPEVRESQCRWHAAKRAEYLTNKVVPKRAFQYSPEIRLLAILRDPVERLVSAYYHHIRYGNLPLIEVNDGLREVLAGTWAERYPKSATLLANGLYADGLDHWGNYFSDQQIQVLFQEDLKIDAGRVFRRILRLLTLNEDYDFVKPRSRSQAVVYDMRRLRVLAWRWLICFESTAEGRKMSHSPLAQLLWRSGEVLDRVLLEKMFGNARPVLESDLERELRAYFDGDVRRLETRTGRDLSHWRIVR